MKEILQDLLNSIWLNYLIISVVFFFVWVDLLVDSTSIVSVLTVMLPSRSVAVLGLILPILLLLGAIFFKSRVVFLLTVFIFVIDILINLGGFVINVRSIGYDRSLSSTYDPVSFAGRNLKLLSFCSFAIFLMSRQLMLEQFKLDLQWSNLSRWFLSFAIATFSILIIFGLWYGQKVFDF